MRDTVLPRDAKQSTVTPQYVICLSVCLSVRLSIRDVQLGTVIT